MKELPLDFDDPRHWRALREDVRALAEAMKQPKTKAAMLRLAENYEYLARRSEARGRANGNYRFGSRVRCHRQFRCYGQSPRREVGSGKDG